MHERLTNLRPVIFLQFANGAPQAEVWRALHAAANFQAGCGKIVVAVSQDIDPENLDGVLWSLAYRSNPAQDVHIGPHGGGLQGSQYGRSKSDSCMLIDATLKNPMPPLALPTREFMERARKLWDELGLPPLNPPSPPWHGYQLGEWSERWELFARRTTAGDWERNGTETLARTRKGLTPETPAASVETESKSV
jgi:4-hydroxy-3-polyprenylbenzoate decarboxylase